MKFAHLEDVHIGFYLTVNKLTTDKTQNMFYLIAEHFDFIKYYLNKLDSMAYFF